MNSNSSVSYFKRPFEEKVSFNRQEVGVILSVYGKMVAAGEWRDYGISMLGDAAIFSIFRRSAENPIYTIHKIPKLIVKKQQFSVIGMDGAIIKRGPELRSVLLILEKKLIKLIN